MLLPFRTKANATRKERQHCEFPRLPSARAFQLICAVHVPFKVEYLFRPLSSSVATRDLVATNNSRIPAASCRSVSSLAPRLIFHGSLNWCHWLSGLSTTRTSNRCFQAMTHLRVALLELSVCLHSTVQIQILLFSRSSKRLRALSSRWPSGTSTMASFLQTLSFRAPIGQMRRRGSLPKRCFPAIHCLGGRPSRLRVDILFVCALIQLLVH